mgnify:CR=1 FL=1
MSKKNCYGIIYFVQPAELVGTERYKVGCSSNPSLKRIKTGYKKGTRIINIFKCEAPFEIEKKIKRAFNDKFKLIAGTEYFEGNEQEMSQLFLDIFHNQD